MKTLFSFVAILLWLNVFSQDTIYITSTAYPDLTEHEYNPDNNLCDPILLGTMPWAFLKALDSEEEIVYILFNINGQGPHIINATYPLPQISRRIVVDATTQPGYQTGTPAIILDGGENVNQGISLHGISNSIVKGLCIRNFRYSGIFCNNVNNSEFYDNVIYGIYRLLSDNLLGEGCIGLVGSSNNILKGNILGTDPIGNTYINKYAGINIQKVPSDRIATTPSSGNVIGGTQQGEGNTIVNNPRGVMVGAGCSSNLISGNRIFNNTTAIFLSSGTLFPLELGGNNNKSAPVIDSFNGTTVTGTSDPDDIIEIFGSTGNENANEYLKTVIANEDGNWTTTISTSYQGVIVTATNHINNTSSYCNYYEVLSYNGEFQIWLGNDFYWTKNNLSFNSRIEYKFEIVSFPFIPDKMFDSSNNLTACCSDGLSERNLVLPPNNIINNNVFYQNHGYGWSELILRETVKRPIGYNIHFQNMSQQETTLITGRYLRSLSSWYDASRDFLPHSVIKYTLYYYYDNIIIDSLVLLNDLTRGKMKQYPFGFNYNSINAQPDNYDIIIKSSLLHAQNAYYDNTSNQIWFNAGVTPMGTINYFPNPNTLNENIYPQTFLNVPFIDINDYYNYSHPTPYSLIRSDVMNSLATNFAGFNASGSEMVGIPHTYNIDKNIDLRNINPNEKIIYNPSECEISASNLVFPSGYTFKTLHLPGEYILLDDLKAHYPYVLYDESEWKDIPVSTNSQPAHYIIKSGAKLTIEPCVTIMDAIFTVESGGVLEYDKTQTYGNYQIDPLSEGSFAPTISEFSNCECDCKDFTRYNIMGNIDITSNITWDQAYIESSFEVPTGGTLGIAGKVSVPAGVTLTIKNITIQFSNIGEIIVEPGARLIVDGSTLNSACNKLWVGINVKGNSNLPQLLPNQGFVSLKNGSEIRDASYALNIKGGGIVSTVGTTFKNNKIGIYFNPYQLQSYNASSISNNIFITETQRAFNSLFAHVYLNGVKGVTLKGNDFINTQGSTLISTTGILPLYANGRGYGIYSNNSSFKVLPLCSSPMQYGVSCPENYSDKSNFNGLYYGIKAKTINPAMPVTIQQSSFDGNFRGVLLENFQYPNVLDNEFYGSYSGNGINPNILYPPSYYNTVYGLYLNGCSNYRVEENEFTNGDAGIFVNNSGSSANRIYKNYFNDVSKTIYASALNAIGTNHDISLMTNSGLQFECNTFNTNQYNMSVMGASTIAKFQGSNAMPTGNQSDHFCPYSESDIFVSTSSPLNYNYYYQTGEALSCYSSKITQYPSLDVNNCESQISQAPPISIQQTELASKQDEINLLQSELYGLIDGGNTQYLLDIVEDFKPNSFNKTCNTLLQSTPYLSDTVLLSFMSTNINGHYDKKRDILLACSPLPEKSKEQLNSYFLPPPMKNALLQAQDGINAIDMKKSEIAAQVSVRQILIDRLIAFALYNDSVPEMKDSIISFLYDENTLQVKNYLIPLLISGERYTEAQTQIDEYSTLISDMPYETRLQYENQIQLLSIVKDFSENHEDTNVIANNISFLENLASQTNSIGSVQAITMLEYYKPDLYDYPEIIEFPEMISTRLLNMHSESQESTISDNAINIFPNPANTELFIEYMFSEKSDVELELFSLDGKKVLSKKISGQSGREGIDISQFPVGLYHIRIGSFNKSIAIVR